MTIWTPTTVGTVKLPHRLAKAPMTRDRSRADGVPSDLNVEYDRQRASMSLIITEGIQPSEDGQGYLLTPGIYTDAHIAGWTDVTRAVLDAGGRIVAQLMHVGRISHPDNTPHHRPPLAPSPIAANGAMFTATGPQLMPVPRALTTDEIAVVVDEFCHAAASAISAGFDGVEIHGANGYLIHQFLSSNANQRTDHYGGTITNRTRFAIDVATAVADTIGSERTGIRLSPGNPYNDIIGADTTDLYRASSTRSRHWSLPHLIHGGGEHLVRQLRRAWPTALIVNRPGADLDTRIADLEAGVADVITVGTMALANPDLPARLQAGATLNQPDPNTFYGGDHHGYTDYPSLDQAANESSKR